MPGTGRVRSAAPHRPKADLLYRLLVAALLVALVIVDVSQAIGTSFAWDFRAFFQGGHSYAHLRSPYIARSLADLTSRQNFVYPLPTAALFAPVSLLPYHLAAALFVALSGLLLASSLWLVGVRDPWCYAAVLVSAPALDGLEIGTVSPILAFLVAVIWRYRGSTWVVAGALSLAVLLKLFLWPLGIWLLATRRIRSLLGTVVVSLIALVASAAPLGVDAVRHYPHLLQTVSKLEGPSSLSLVGVGTALTGTALVGTVISLVCGAILLAFVVVCGRRGDESLSFRLALVAALALTPIVWNHYLVLLFVALGMTRPRFSALWLGTAWVLGAVHGDALGGVTLIVALVAVWAIVLAQADVLPAVERLLPEAVARLGGVVVLWIALVWGLAALIQVVPAVAALRGPRAADAPSGTANLRLFHARSVCVTVLTSGLRSPATLQLVDAKRSTVLLTRRLGGERTTACTRYAAADEPRDLGEAFTTKRVRLVLRVQALSGRVQLSGPVVRPSDAR